MFNFETLEAWKRARQYASTVYRLTRSFPREEVFGLTSQMRRAAVSVASNVAEGSSRHSPADYAHFVGIATGSLFESIAQAHIALDQEFLSADSFRDLYVEAEELGRILSGLRTWILSRPRR